jgi:predicted phosphohydrolase
MNAIQNDALVLDGRVICGTRGWALPSEAGTDPEDRRIYERELMRLEMSLKDAQKKGQGLPILVMLHYPPFNERQEPSGFTSLLECYGVQDVVYGHLHGAGIRGGFKGVWRNIRCYLTSCDALGFSLLNLSEASGEIRLDPETED